MSIRPCPREHCGGSLWQDGHRLACHLCWYVKEDRPTASDVLAVTNVPTVLAYREMTARGSHSRQPLTEAQTDGLFVEMDA